jgi:isoleucyl-tRNA synthetase
MESVWWVFAQLWKKDLVYKGFKVTFESGHNPELVVWYKQA